MQAKQLARSDDETQPHTAANTRTTILIVDDDTAARLTISAMISNDDYRVVLGTGAAEAHERLPLIEPDVTICDFVMDGVSGDQFFRWPEADRTWRYVPIIAGSTTRSCAPICSTPAPMRSLPNRSTPRNCAPWYMPP